MPVHVGTSGWQYRDWRGVLYPDRVPQRLWLPAYAGELSTVENNNAFYRLPERDTFERWRDATPRGFVMTVKASRYLTHVKRLADPSEPVARLLDRAAGLGDRQGPVLVQLPPTLRADLGRLAETLGAFGGRVRVAVEARHESWWTDEVRALLARHDAALCWADRASRPVTPLWRTAEWGYVRLHGGSAQPWPRYGRRALASWVRRVREAFGTRLVDSSLRGGGSSPDVYVYFNNDPGGAAVEDARVMRRLLSE